LPAASIDGLASVTFMAWVKPTTVVTHTRVFDFGNGIAPTATAGGYIFLTPSNGSVVRFAITTSGYANEQGLSGTAALAAGSWTHVAVTIGSGVGRLYVNGALVNTNNAMTLTPAALGSLTTNYIGRSQFAADPYFNGAVDDLRIYSEALSASQIALFAAPLAAPQNLAATPGPLSLGLSWNAVPNASNYTVKYSTTSGGPYTTLSAGLPSLTQEHSNLSFGTTYYYVVSAANAAYEGPGSAEIAATPASASISESESTPPHLALIPASGETPPTATLTTSTSVPGHLYQLQTSTDLSTGSWFDVGDPVQGSGEPIQFSTPYDPSEPRRFYRIVVTR
jgi:hypothetical protein